MRRRKPRARLRRPPSLADEPTAEIERLLTREMRGECGIDGGEEMMALVEDVARGERLLLGAEGRLDHHQSVVGDDDLGLAGAAHAALDEALAVVRTGGVDAFTTPIREAERAPGARMSGSQPGRSPPAMSPSRVAIAQRAISPKATASKGRWPSSPASSARLSRHR